LEIIEAGKEEFANVIAKPYHVYGSAAFADLNRVKAESIHFLLFKKGKYRLGLTAGIRGNILLSPFSAPFGGFMFISDDIRLDMIDEAIKLLLEWAQSKNAESVRITLPPPIYNEKFISKQLNCLYRAGFHIENLDLNYFYLLSKFDQNYPVRIWRNARKNLNIALQNDLTFLKCERQDEKKLAYEVIRRNREARGFPLRMSLEQVYETTKLIPADFFMVNDKAGNSIAAAIAFGVNKKIYQVIYWGDLPETNHLRTMNFLSFKIFEYYPKTGMEILDIGPSTENSIPNIGLCEFKESIGCDINIKFTLTKGL
jgi:hypothetical protein